MICPHDLATVLAHCLASEGLEREAKLFGLDAPTKVAPTTPDGLTQYTGQSDSIEEARVKIAEMLQSVGIKSKNLSGGPSQVGLIQVGKYKPRSEPLRTLPLPP